MTNVRALLDRARDAGHELRLGLVAQDQAFMSVDLRAEIASLKPDIISTLANDWLQHQRYMHHIHPYVLRAKRENNDSLPG